MKQNLTGIEIKQYYQELQRYAMDGRNPKGKRHELALVLTTMVIATLRVVGALNVSAIYRQMCREHVDVVGYLGLGKRKMVSDSQFRRLLKVVDYTVFNSVNDRYFNVCITESAGLWKAIDGKELRGSIDGVSGQKRGENVVRMVSHTEKTSQILGFYHGQKESEKTIVRDFFTHQTDLKGASYSFDALHTSSELLETIDSKSGIYLAQVKNNQPILLAECIHLAQNMVPTHQYQSIDKQHGREEIRNGYVMPMNVSSLEKRWNSSNINTLIVVERKVRISKNQHFRHEIAFYVSNKKLTKKTGLELFRAVRDHWMIEADNWVRDVTFGEDRIRCKDSNQIRTIASTINLIINRIRPKDTNNNMRAFKEELIFNKNNAIALLKAS
jgi:predicted transposase YbfD/YdcC